MSRAEEPVFVTRLRAFCAKWRESEQDPRTGGGEVDFDLLASVCDAFETFDEEQQKPRAEVTP